MFCTVSETVTPLGTWFGPKKERYVGLMAVSRPAVPHLSVFVELLAMVAGERDEGAVA